jgi:hypothetical protein
MDPNPDYDVSDELEYGINWFAWILRGAYPPPAYPRSSTGSGDDVTQTSDVQSAARTFYLERKPCWQRRPVARCCRWPFRRRHWRLARLGD